MNEKNGVLIHFSKQVSIIGGAIIVTATMVGWLWALIWNISSRPLVDAINKLQDGQIVLQAGQVAGQHRDSIMVEQIAKIGESLAAPAGSYASKSAAKEAAQVPDVLQQEQRKGHRGRR